MNSKYNWIIDAGHGGINSRGTYTTAPAKMKVFEDGYTIYEGQVNRQIAEKLCKGLEKLKIDYAIIHDEVLDNTLFNRFSLANRIFKKNPSSILLSIHSNATTNGGELPSPEGKGKGFEVWTSPGQTKSDTIASILCRTYISCFPEFKFRSGLTGDGDLDQEAKFAMLVHTLCPSVLVENLFFDNRAEAEFLKSHEGQTRISDCLLKWIVEIEEKQPI